MTLTVPQVKDASFAIELFSTLSDSLSELVMEHGKWPNSLVFTGPLGTELYLFITEKAWDLARFHPVNLGGIVNKITIEYSKPLDQIEDSNGAIFAESFNNKVVNGMLSKETVQKIMTKYATPSFKIERQVRPKLEIKLSRAK